MTAVLSPGDRFGATDHTMLADPIGATLGLFSDSTAFVPTPDSSGVRDDFDLLLARYDEHRLNEALSFTVLVGHGSAWSFAGQGRWFGPNVEDVAIDPFFTATDVVADINARTGLPVTATLKAAGIKRRTYYSWVNAPGTAPRLASLGLLDELSQLVEDIEEVLGSATWLALPPQRKRLEAGDLNGLLLDAIDLVQPKDPQAGPFAPQGDDRILAKSTRVLPPPRTERLS